MLFEHGVGAGVIFKKLAHLDGDRLLLVCRIHFRLSSLGLVFPFYFYYTHSFQYLRQSATRHSPYSALDSPQIDTFLSEL